MNRIVVIVIALLAAAGLVYAAVTLTEAGPADPPATRLPAAAPTPSSTLASTSTTSSTTPPLLPLATEAPDVTTTYLVWVSGGLLPDLVDGLMAAFDVISIVKGDTVELAAGDGAVIPLDALAVDPSAHRPFDPERALASLRPGSVILGETSAALRQVAAGDELTLAGETYEIAAVVPDEIVAAAEVVFDQSDPDLPIATDRYALIITDLAQAEVEAAVDDIHDSENLRVRVEGETPWLRHADAVLPQVFIKLALGEFSYTNRTGGVFDQDPGFKEEWIVTTDIPVLGEVVCHKVVTVMLEGAMAELGDEGLADLVDPAGFAGCWYPRFTRTATGSPAGISRHSWGAAVDINAPTNPFGSEGTQDARLVEVMKRWGFNWGGDWALPDPMHFEYSGLAQQP